MFKYCEIDIIMIRRNDVNFIKIKKVSCFKYLELDFEIVFIMFYSVEFIMKRMFGENYY